MMEKKKFCIVVPTSFMMRYFKGQLRFLSERFEVTAISSERDWLENFGKTEGIDTCCIPIERFPSVWKDLRSLWRLYRHFRSHRPDIVHTHTAKALLPLLAARLAGVQVRVYMAHGSLHQGYSGWRCVLIKSIERAICRFSTEILCVSFGVKELLLEERICREKDSVKVIRYGTCSGIDVDWFDSSMFNRELLRDGSNIPRGNFVFCFVGRINEEKGVNELVRAFQNLSVRHKDVHLLLVGPEERHRGIDRKTAEVIAGHPSIHAVGYREDIRPFLAMSDALVLPSYREGLGQTLLEANAMELPCIATDIIGCREAVEDGVTGSLVPPRNERALYEKMEWFYEHRNELKRMGECGRQRVIARYRQHDVWHAYREEYVSLVDRTTH